MWQKEPKAKLQELKSMDDQVEAATDAYQADMVFPDCKGYIDG